MATTRKIALTKPTTDGVEIVYPKTSSDIVEYQDITVEEKLDELDTYKVDTIKHRYTINSSGWYRLANNDVLDNTLLSINEVHNKVGNGSSFNVLINMTNTETKLSLLSLAKDNGALNQITKIRIVLESGVRYLEVYYKNNSSYTHNLSLTNLNTDNLWNVNNPISVSETVSDGAILDELDLTQTRVMMAPIVGENLELSNGYLIADDTKVTNTLNNTTKAYVTGTIKNVTNTGTQIFDGDIYIDTVAGQLAAKTFKGDLIGNADSATKLETGRTFTWTNDATGSLFFDGTKDVSATLTLKDSGVTAGTYGQSTDSSPGVSGTFKVPYFTVDSKGRLTAASTKTITMPTDTLVTNTLNNSTKAYVTGTTSASTNTGTQIFDSNIYIDTTEGQLVAKTFKGALLGNADSATKLQTTRTLSWTGDATGSFTFDGTADKSTALTLANSGVTAGSYGQSTNASPGVSGTFSVPYFTVDSKGRVTAASTKTITMPTDTLVTNTLNTTTKAYLTGTTSATTNTGTQIFDTGVYLGAEAGQLVAKTFVGSFTGNSSTSTKLETARNIAISGDATGNADFDGTSNITINTTLVNSGVTAGSYGQSSNASPGVSGTFKVPYFTVDAKGRVTSASTKTITMPTDTLVTNTLATTTKAYVTGTTSATTNTGTQVFDTGVYLDTTAGKLVATTFSGALSGNASSASKLQTARTLSLTGAITGSVSFDGSKDASITTSYKPSQLEFTGVPTNAGHGGYIDFHYNGSTSDYTSRIIESSSGTLTLNSVTINGSTITGTLSGNASSASKLATARTLSWTGDATGSLSFDGSANKSTALTLANSGVTAGSYGPSANASPAAKGTFSVPYVTVDSKGRVTAASTKTITLPNSTAVSVTQVIGSGYQIGSISVDGTSTTLYAPTAKSGTGISVTEWKWNNTTNTHEYTITNTGVRSIATGSSNGTISVNTNGTTTNVAVKGLGSAAYTNTDAYLPNSNSGVTAGSYGPSANASPAHSGTFSVPYITVDAKGRVTSASTKTITLPADNNTTYNLGSFAITATAAELNVLDGITATTTELNYTDGVTSNIQTQLNGKASSSHTHTSLVGNTDNRSVATTPNNYNSVFSVAGLKSNSTIGLNTTTYGTYSGVIGFRPWSDNSGGNAHELAFTGNGAIMHRYGADTTWGSWERIITSANYTSYAASASHTHNYAGSSSAGGAATTALACSGNAATATKLATARTLSWTGDATGSLSFDGSANKSASITLASSGVTAGSYGPSANASPAHSGTFSVPYITVDSKGRVTSASTKTITLPADNNTDTKVTNTLATTTKAYITGTTSATTNTGTQIFDTGVYLDTTAGKLVAGSFSGNGASLTSLSAGNISSGTLAAARLATSGVTAGSYGPSANASPNHSGTFSVPYITVDTYGRVTGASTKTITLPSGSNVTVTNKISTGRSIADITIDGTSNIIYGPTVYPGTGISVSDGYNTGDSSPYKYTISNTGVLSIATGSTNGTISVNTGGTSAEVVVKGLGTAAYTSSDLYMRKSNPTGTGYVNIGASNTVSGTNAVGMGNTNTASGYCSVALGYGGTASKNYAFTMGKDNSCACAFGVALGYSNTVGGEYSNFTIGDNNTVTTASYSYVLGGDNTVTGNGNTSGSSIQNTVIGYKNTVNYTTSSTVIGHNNTITSTEDNSNYIYAFGQNLTYSGGSDNGITQILLGRYNQTGNHQTGVFIGSGTSDTNRITAIRIRETQTDISNNVGINKFYASYFNRALSGSIYDGRVYKVADIGTYASGYSDYSSSQYLTIFTVGQMVYVQGAFKNTTAGTGSGTSVLVATVPIPGPTQQVVQLCQGSSACQWCCVLGRNSSGYLTISHQRYSSGGSYTTYNATTWFCVPTIMYVNPNI